MATTLTKGVDALTLSDDLLWADEFAYEPVAARSGYSVGGALIVDTAAKLTGRSVVLESRENSGWVLRSDLLTLNAWRALPGQIFTLAYRGESHTVVFDHERGAIEASIVGFEYAELDGSEYYRVTLRFLEI